MSVLGSGLIQGGEDVLVSFVSGSFVFDLLSSGAFP